MPYIPPDYLDNTPNRVLAEHLRRIIIDWEQRHLDIASGFFDPAVWKSLKEALPLLEGFRLLIGKEPELEAQGGTGTFDLQKYYRRKIQGDLESLPYNPAYAEMVDGLLAFLRRESVQAKLYPSFLHAKAYIFPQIAIVGSSNFTEAGLHRKAELNLVRKEETAAKALREEWFEPFWNEAADYKPELLSALEDSKFGTTAYTPFDVFIKALYEYFKDRLTAETPEAYIGVNLAGFQQEGLREAIRLLDRHRAVLVADAVGLGKTYVGMGLLEHYLLRKRRRGHIPRGLVVCPAQLRDLVWKPKLDEYGIKASILSMEELGRADFDWKAFSKFDLVLVDESHNFRNPGTGRYQNLSKLIGTGDRDKYVILMTATPINNSIWDLYHQMMLMTRGSESYYRDNGISNLKGFFQRVADDGAELFDLLEQSAVRRSRYDVKKRIAAGEKVTLPGKGEIRFPERRLKAIDYDLEKTYKGFYEEIASQIEQLNLVSYNIEAFKHQSDKNEINRNNALIGILKTTFLKRLESSLRAFEVSVERQRKFQRRFFDLLQQGRLLDSPRHRKILALEDEGEETAVDELVASLPEVSAEEYDLAAIRERLEADIQSLDDMLGWAKIVREESGDAYGQDAKLAEFKSQLAGELKGQKVLVFTYYEDTARYLHEKLSADTEWVELAGQPRLGIISGKTDPSSRENIVRRFAPVANTPADPVTGQPNERELQKLRAEEIQILISTDVLSEGQNLQDAGVLINYDLHWNPVRMIQRAGRIDRLGTAFETLSIYNCFPEKGLESLLRLVERLQQRIRDIDRTVGLDASVLGEIIHPKSQEDLKRIKSGENQVMDELERASELLSADEMKLPLLMYLQAVGAEKLSEIPLGIHSIKRSNQPGLFFAFRARERHFWRFYPADGSTPMSDIRRIFRMLQCVREEPRLEADRQVFEEVERAASDILRDLQSLRAAQRIRPQMSGLNKKFYDALNQMSLFGEVPPELRNRLNQVLQNISLRMFERDPKLKAILQTYQANENPNPQVLAEQLDAFFMDNELYREIIEPTVLEQIKKDDLQLVCYEIFVSE
jgi:superfamily II DNA or RNA helicase